MDSIGDRIDKLEESIEELENAKILGKQRNAVKAIRGWLSDSKNFNCLDNKSVKQIIEELVRVLDSHSKKSADWNHTLLESIFLGGGNSQG